MSAAGVLRGGLWALTLGCGATLLGYLVWWATDEGQNPKNLQDLAAAFAPLSGATALAVICTQFALLAAVLLTLAMRRLPNDPAKQKKAGSGGLVEKVQRAMSYQLAPRTFWSDWCGGLSVAEALGVGAWLFLNIFWFAAGMNRIFKPTPFGTTWEDNLDGAAKLFGQMIAPNLMLLFLPIPHTNFVTWLTGTSRNRLIRFHRWMGHGTLWIITIHALLYYALWTAQHNFSQQFSAWGGTGTVNNLAGSSLSWVRRHFYEFFFRFHIACFVAFFILSCAHYADCWLYFAPGLLLYAADLALRAGQMSNLTTVAAATVDEASSVATLVIPVDKELKHRPLSEVWLLLPALSRWQWHPFSVASGGGRVLKLHVKQYGRFTKGLLELLRRRQPVAVRLSGPMGAEAVASCDLTPPPAWRKYDVAVMVCGGVGVTGMLSMLRAMVAAREAGGAQGLPRRVHCIWTARHMGEFLALDAPLLRAAAAGDGWLTLHLHLTGHLTVSGVNLLHRLDEQEQQRQAAAAKGADPDPSVASSTATATTAAAPGEVSLRERFSPPAPGGAPVPVRMPWASAYFWSLLRPAQPLAFGTLQLGIVFVLAFLGGLCGALLGTSYQDQPSTQPWQAGMVLCVLVSATSVSLPFTLAVWPVQAYRYWLAARESTGPQAEEHTAQPYGEQAALVGQACTLEGHRVVVPGEGVSVDAARGRPDVSTYLVAAAEEGGVDTVGVFAGGPSGMMQTVHLAVAALNGREGARVYFDLHNEAVEL